MRIGWLPSDCGVELDGYNGWFHPNCDNKIHPSLTNWRILILVPWFLLQTHFPILFPWSPLLRRKHRLCLSVNINHFYQLQLLYITFWFSWLDFFHIITFALPLLSTLCSGFKEIAYWLINRISNPKGSDVSHLKYIK